MIAAEALRVARAAGVRVSGVGTDLLLEGTAPPPRDVVECLSRHKAAILAFMRPGQDGWSPEDWLVHFDERAGIAEFDGGLSRAQAEVFAGTCCTQEWLSRNPGRSRTDAVAALTTMGISLEFPDDFGKNGGA